MLQTEKISTNCTNKKTAINEVEAQTNKQADIVKRLEELNRWQEEQKKLLEARQTMQRQMLGMEQKTMYQMLGLQSASETTLIAEEEEQEMPGETVEQFKRLQHYAQEYDEESLAESLEVSQGDGEEETELEQEKEVEPSSYKTLTSGYETEMGTDKQQTKPKKPFLKRGAGLKQRFKIDPEELRLNNLPKYKYANAHPRLRLKPPGKLNGSKKMEATTMCNKTNNTKPNNNSAKSAQTLDAQEQRFQNLLISSKNMCSSTPDTKSSINFNKKSINTLTEQSNIPQNVCQRPKDESPKQTVIVPMVAWSKILDPLEIEPLQVPRNRVQSLPETEESIFELLEQKAKNGSFDMDSTCLKQFMQRRITEKLNETEDNIPVQAEIRNRRLQPLVTANKNQDISSSSSEDGEEETQQANETESSGSDDTTHKTIKSTNSSYQPIEPNTQVRVRFSDSNETHEYEEEPESTLNETSRLSAGSTEQEGQGDCSNNELFQQFKQALFAALQVKADQHLANDTTINSLNNDTTLTTTTLNSNNNNSIYSSPACQELQEKTDMIKVRLIELEKEIQNFKDNNILLMKAKQEHELEKSLHAQEHLEAMERLKDEKIQIEIYLHDERVKLEDEKRQFEQNMKMKTQGLIAKERKECERLREQVNQLEMQLKTKETNHTSAQARLRTQIRNLEREQSRLHEQIENLMRENKRLENENFKISREQNNKILLEINRNIAKLAPKQIQNSSTSMPDEGPPTLAASRTMSKSIVAAATANKNSTKAHKTTNSRFSPEKLNTNKKSPPLTPQQVDTTRDETFHEERLGSQQTNKYAMNIEEDEDEEDILKEFQMTPAQINNNITNKKTPARLSNSKQQQQQIPETSPPPPPSSPRVSGDHNKTTNNMKREIVNADGSKDIWYPNGNLKKISADGMIIRMLYYNKDIKETNINEGTVKYYYAETNTWHTTYLDGLEILEFPNGQVEHRHKNGIIEVHYPNNSIKIMDPKDEHKQEEWRFADGTHLVQMRNGDKILSLPNGQKEIHNKLHKRREYPDGTVKIVYPDGSTETRYSNGRVRLKDKEGKLVMDTDMAK